MTRKLVYYPNRKGWQINVSISGKESDNLHKFLERFKSLDKKTKCGWKERKQFCSY